MHGLNRRHLLCAVVLVLMIAPVGPGLAQAAPKKPKASLTVKAPASVLNESLWNVSASGYSGPYNTLTVSTEMGVARCTTPERSFNKLTKRIAKNHKFNVTFTDELTVKPPQTRTLCVFLYAGSGNRFIVKESRFQIN
jgi:hypothetical protein